MIDALNQQFAHILWQSYRKNLFSILMLVTSLTIAVTGLACVLIINSSAKQSYNTQQIALIDNVKYSVFAKQPTHPIQKADYAALRRVGFSELVAIARFRRYVYGHQEKITERGIEFIGVDAYSALEVYTHRSSSQVKNTASGIAAITTSSALLHPQLLKQLEQNTEQPRDTWSVSYEGVSKPLPPLSPYHSASLGNQIILDIALFYSLFPNEPLGELLFASELEGKALSLRIDALVSQLPAHLDIRPIATAEQQNDMTGSFHLNLLAMALLMFAVCLFIVLNAVNLTLANRLSWLKVCRQLGISRSAIIVTQCIELAALTFFSCCIGTVLSVYLANAVSPAIQATLSGLYSVNVGFGRLSLVGLFIQVFCVSLLGVGVASVFSFKQCNEQLTSTKPKTDNEPSKTSYFLIVSAILGFSALFVFKHVHSLSWLLIATAAVILSGCFVLIASYPLSLQVIHWCIPNRFPLLKVSTQHSIALSKKTRIACCAFFIAATSNIGMNLMVDSFRSATISWLETRLVSDFYFYYRGDQDVVALAKQHNITLLPRYERYLDYENTVLQQFSYPTTPDFQNAMVFYAIDHPSDAWEQFEKGEAVFVNQQFAFSFNKSLNDTLELPDPRTQESKRYRIKGIIYDFGNTSKQVLFPLSSFARSSAVSSIYYLNANDANISDFRASLQALGIDHERQLISADQLLSLSSQTFDNTFLITDGINIVTLLVAALSLACAIIMLMHDTRPHNMLIRSLGVSVLKTQGLAFYQYSVLCSIALLFAIPFGILLSYILVFDINLQAFQWTYPLEIAIGKLFKVVAISLAIVIIVIAIPIIRMTKKPLIEDIRWLN